MNHLKTTIITLMSLTLITACHKDCDENYAGFESYRYELWKLLLNNDYQFDFVGTQSDNGNTQQT